MRILTRYFLRAHLGPFLFALSVLTGILMVNAVARRFEELAGKGLPTSVIAEVFILSLPHIIALTLPMAVLVAVLYAFSQLAADNEVTALKASGVHLARTLVPILVAGALLSVAMVWFNDQVLPDTNHRLKNLLVDIGRKSPTLELKEQVINEIRAGSRRSRYFLQAAKVEPATNRLFDVAIYDLSEPGRSRTIYADSGRMAFNRERTDLFLTLHDGWIQEADQLQPATFQRLFFDRQLIRIEGVGNQLERRDGSYRSDREMSLGMLAAEADDARREAMNLTEQARAMARDALGRALGDPDTAAAAVAAPEPRDGPVRRSVPISRGGRAATESGLSAAARTAQIAATEIRQLNDRAGAALRRYNRYAVEYHKKYSIAFACIVFVLIGAPIAVRFPRGGIGMVITVSMVIFAIYYMGLIGGEKLADKGFVTPFWAMWAHNLIFLALGAWGLIRIGHEASTARGGGWDDLIHSVVGLLARPFRKAGAS